MAVPEEIQKQVLAEATSATPNYSVDYNDPRFGKVESEEKQDLSEIQQTYGGMIADSDKYFQQQIDATEAWGDKQAQLQQEQTDFAIEKIEQQKEQAQKDYIKEQSGAYVDWQKQSNAYGTEAEKIASNGLTNTGFSESSQVSMYNTYQNRVATARESLNRAKLEYDNSIKEAMLQNNAVLAEIAFNTLQKKCELSLQGFQYRNDLILEMTDKKFQTKQHYDNLWQNTYDNIMREYALAEDVRQFDTRLEFDAEQNQLNREHQSAENKLQRDFEKAEAALERKFKADQEALNRKHDEKMLAAKNKHEKEILAQEHKNAMAKLAQQHQNDMAKLNQQLANEKALLNYQNSLKSSSGSVITKASSGTTKKSSSGSYKASSGKVHSGGGGSFGNSNYTPTYEDAVAYMKQNGVSSARASGIKTRNEFTRTSTYQGKKMTYEEYISAYVSTELAAAKVAKRKR